jgi:hypothetical protein
VPSGLRESAKAISARIGTNASYSIFVRPPITDVEPAASPDRGHQVLRLLWLASLTLLFVVLTLAILVALGL